MNLSIYYVGRKASIGKASILRMTSTRLRAEAHERGLMLPDVIAGIPAILLGAAELCGALPGLKMETPRMPTTGPASTRPLIETHRVLGIYMNLFSLQHLSVPSLRSMPMGVNGSTTERTGLFQFLSALLEVRPHPRHGKYHLMLLILSRLWLFLWTLVSKRLHAALLSAPGKQMT